MSYLTNQKTRKRIDSLLRQNAVYRAQEICKTNTNTRKEEVNRHCRVNFINPIRDIDLDFYNSIKNTE